MKRNLFSALAGLFIGCLTGFLGTWVDYLSDTSSKPSAIIDYSGMVLLIPSAPGSIIAQLHWDYDWCVGGEWDYRWPITGFNGLFWMIFTPIIAFYVYLARCLPRDVKQAYRKWINYGKGDIRYWRVELGLTVSPNGRK